MVDQSVDGVTILGVLGESNRLSDHEREQLIGRAVQTIGGRTPIIVGTSHTGTRVAAYLARRAQDLGGDAVMVTPAREAVHNGDRPSAEQPARAHAARHRHHPSPGTRTYDASDGILPMSPPHQERPGPERPFVSATASR